ncbi:MAG: NAD(P)-binding domain-containing protein, partial [Lachnospiraceae bacterium]|nr:NAD(P)-binding domain-containing protein [Lachnospiraceae bacterium]
MKKIGFIGSGNMASAIMGGIIKKGVFTPEQIIASDLSEAARKRVADQLGVSVTDCNKSVVEEAEVVVLSVKPQYYEAVIGDIKDSVTVNQIIITIAPGWTLEKVLNLF